MDKYTIVFFEFLKVKKEPKFQYWLNGQNDVIIDYTLSKNPNIPKEAYTKTLIRAKTLIHSINLNEIKKKMSSNFIDFNIYLSEELTITGNIAEFNHILFPHFQNKTEL